MDTFARGLRNAAHVIDQGILDKCVKVHSMCGTACAGEYTLMCLQERYASFDSGIGAAVESGQMTLAKLEVCVLHETLHNRCIIIALSLLCVCVCVCVTLLNVCVYRSTYNRMATHSQHQDNRRCTKCS